jgi:seryl-tRNA synthetase
LGLLDFERAAKVSGARFVFMKGALARLELAVVSFFLDSARERGYLELVPPYLVNADSMRSTPRSASPWACSTSSAPPR